MSGFVAMQQIVEPGVEHVEELQDQRGDENSPTAKGSGAEGV